MEGSFSPGGKIMAPFVEVTSECSILYWKPQITEQQKILIKFIIYFTLLFDKCWLGRKKNICKFATKCDSRIDKQLINN